MNIRYCFLSICFIVLLSSCVSTKKYQSALSREQALLSEREQLTNEKESLTNNLKQLNGRISGLENDINRLTGQMDEAGKNAAQLARMANMTQQQLEDEQKRMAQMRQLMDQQRQAIENLRKKMTDALVNFKSDELSVFVKNGKVYVSLQESLLFPSGSATVNPKGKQALGTLAQVLNSNPDISVLIEGHTDSIPMRGKYEDNWALSTARATAIVRILTDTYKVEPTRVTASGRSKYEPVDVNETAEGRARNRRTEIILAPKLDELLRLLEQTPANTSGTD
ncbi:MAG TPA: OmpA family protein [Chitinophagaceae bacterium]|nr:OmpA family protein [Chitinophagaceae bacterium]